MDPRFPASEHEEHEMVHVFVATAYDPATQRGAWAYTVGGDGSLVWASGLLPETSTERLEYWAIIQAISHIKLLQFRHIWVHQPSATMTDYLTSSAPPTHNRDLYSLALRASRRFEEFVIEDDPPASLPFDIAQTTLAFGE